MAIRVQLSLNAQRLDPDLGKSTLGAWEALLAETSAELPPAVLPLFQTNGPDRTWQWLRVQAVSSPSGPEGLVCPPGRELTRWLALWIGGGGCSTLRAT